MFELLLLKSFRLVRFSQCAPSQDGEGHGGDNDPIDVMEVGNGPLPMGTIVAIKVLG